MHWQGFSAKGESDVNGNIAGDAVLGIATVLDNLSTWDVLIYGVYDFPALRRQFRSYKDESRCDLRRELREREARVE
jgi:hypothetical protein